MEADPAAEPRPRGLGGPALFTGVLALVFAFVPIVGEYVAAPAAVVAVVLGLVGFDRAERGLADDGARALTGGVLGLVAGLVVFFVFLATLG
ncbi:hypothetical protein E1262_11475 [Jiangella aurantiaca]|uniref:DUF4190 domain-containing protein n=1 Tax=Jiangella aurantiaca TaxID=2530373 RepID=A0A4R5AG47_9ACTN|nr:hypothetical protein [Jiangella aurantiaca]TDD69884.1 hypothetical protein E1262_11475 [Jiangella aurantiaca]